MVFPEARLETRGKRNGKWQRGVVYFLSSLTLAHLHCLDITRQEEQNRVRTPSAARVLGTLRRVVISLAHAAVNRTRQENPKTKRNTGAFQQRLRSVRGGRERLQALVFAKSPDVLSLAD